MGRYLIFLLLVGFVSCQKDKTARVLDLSLDYKGLQIASSADPAEEASYDEFSSVMANSVSLSPYGLVYPGMDTIVFDKAGMDWGEVTDGLEAQILWAQSRNISIMLKPQIRFTDNIRTSRTYAAQSTDAWNQFESSYTAFILHHADLAEAHGVDLFCIGDDLKNFTTSRPSYWLSLIDSVRAHYSGEIVYAANHDDYDLVAFWEYLDFIGVNANYQVSTDQTPDADAVEQQWQTYLDDLESFSADLNLSVLITEIGYQSADYAGENPEILDTEAAYNVDAQSNCYKGLFFGLDGRDWVKGCFLKEWFIDGVNTGGASDNGFTPQNKPAATILQMLYGA